MEGVSRNTENASLERILISYSEYERLKNIEQEYMHLQQQQQRKHSLESQNKSEEDQIGEGSEIPHKKLKLTNFLNEDTDEESSVLDKIATLVASKIQGTSTYTALFKPKELSAPLTIGIATPNTTPPLNFGFSIKKNDENDDFGMHSILIYFVKKMLCTNQL